MRLSTILLAVPLALWLTACATPTAPPAREEILSQLDGVLIDGRTTKEAVLLRFGMPTAQFEGERILTYRLTTDAQRKLIPAARDLDLADPRFSAWKKSDHNLVLVFDEHHVLARHRCIRVK